MPILLSSFVAPRMRRATMVVIFVLILQSSPSSRGRSSQNCLMALHIEVSVHSPLLICSSLFLKPTLFTSSEESADGMMECSLRPLSRSLQIHPASESAPLPVLQPGATTCSSLWPGQHRAIYRPFVSIQNAVPDTHNPTFLHRVTAS